jgi:hypothetical protein
MAAPPVRHRPHGRWICALALLLPAAASAASAVAFAADHTTGFAYGHADEASASAAALQACARRTRLSCSIAVACSSAGFGAVAYRRYPVGRVESAGGACGAASAQEAFRLAMQACNQGAKTGRCGMPRRAWHDDRE